MRQISIASGKVVFPEDWEILNIDDASTSNYAYVLEVKKYKSYAFPHFLIFSNDETMTNEKELEYVNKVRCLDSHYREVLDLAVPLELDLMGMATNWEESNASPVPGVFKIYDSDNKHYTTPLGAVIIRNKTNN